MTKIMHSKTYLSVLLFCMLLTNSCTEDFEKLNSNPESIDSVEPETLFYKAQTEMFTSSSFWYDTYACKLRWMQYCSNIWGYSTTNFTYFSSSIGSGIYDEYNKVGAYMASAMNTIEENNQTSIYSTLIQMGKILIITKAMQTTDMHGSLAYTEAWQSAEIPNPSFESQEELYQLWDQDLQTCIETLKNPPSDTKALGSYDRAYGGQTTQWIKAANALRLRIALRLWKRLPDVASQIAADVLAPANAENVPQSIDDSFILWHANDYTTYNSGDWHSIYDMNCASRPFMEYLKTYQDPRKEIFFEINNLSEENIQAYNSQEESNKTGGNITEQMTRWEGGTVSYDERSTDEPYLSRFLYREDGAINMRAMNYPQTRLWKGTGYDGTGSGGNFVPLLTYADFCFMAAEFVFAGNVMSTASAGEWYTNGVTASLKQWDQVADYCDVYDYEALTDAEIQGFLTQPGIAWNEAIGLEQIYTQFYVENFKNINESWAMWKRIGYPNTSSSIIKFDPVVVNGVQQTIPRKVRFTYPKQGEVNYDNIKARLDEMALYPEFGSVKDEFGRLWWEN